MPELPEVESVLRSLRDSTPSLIGMTVRKVDVVRPSVVDGSDHQAVTALVGARFNTLQRHGKYLFLGLETPSGIQKWLALHLRMTGRLFLVKESTAQQRHTRLVFFLNDGWALRFDDPRAFGRVWPIPHPDEVIAGLGPDGLTVTQQTFVDRLARQRRQLKPLLLDQSFVAGLGNIYADESLFRARLHPLQAAATLGNEARERLFLAVHNVLKQAVACKGANIDGVFEAGCFPVAVYGRDGSGCPVCGTVIQKLRVGQRGTHICPSCQQLQLCDAMRGRK